MKVFAILLLTLTIQLSFAQSASDVFKMEFPQLSGVDYTDDAELNAEKIALYRAQYKQLKVSLKDIDKYQQGVEEGLEVFDAKDLKGLQKDEQFKPLLNMVKSNTIDMKIYLSDKTKYGVDSVECIEQSSIVKSLIDGKDYENVYSPWKLLFNYYPISSKNIYLWGEKLMEQRIISSLKGAKSKYIEGKKLIKAAREYKESDVEKYNEMATKANALMNEKDSLMNIKNGWVDSLLLVYDKRSKYFGKTSKQYGAGYLKGKKGIALYKYRRNEDLELAYKLLNESVKEQAEYPSLSAIQYFFFATDEMYSKKKLKAPGVVDDYTLTQDVLADYIVKLEKLHKQTNKSVYAKQKKSAEGVAENLTDKFAGGEYAKCSVLAPAFAKKFDEKKTDVEWLRKVISILNKRRGEESKECKSSQFYEDATIALHDLEPNAKSAYLLAQLNLKKENPNYELAAKYYKEAYSQETDSMKKSEYYYDAAVVASARGQLSKSRSLAQSALDLDGSMGVAYILIGKLYVKSVGQCGSNNFEKSCVYWIAADMMLKAKSVDSSVSKEANGYAGAYSSKFPRKEEAFMRGVKPGDAVSINCWIQRTTTARFVK